MKLRSTNVVCALGAGVMCCGSASAQSFTLITSMGMSAEVEFSLLDSSTLEVRLANLSTSMPAGFEASDQILTGVSWEFGDAGVSIAGGRVRIGDTSHSLNFSTGFYGAGADVSGEWGFGNSGATGMFDHYISANAAGTTAFGSVNLDGPSSLAGPSGGLVADPLPMSIGGQSGIQHEIVATLDLNGTLDDLDAIELVTFEFGSDKAFFTVPTPASAVPLGGALLFAARRRR